MKMKKWLAFLLALTMLLSLCACGSDSGDKKDKNKDKVATTTKATSLKDVVEDNVQTDDKFTDDEKDDIHVDINTELPTKEDGIVNIALFGLDERGETGETVDGIGNGKSFHSDAVIILTIDRRDSRSPKIKMSSIARDTLVYVEGYDEYYQRGDLGDRTKLCNAFDFGYRKAKSADTAGALTEEDYKREGAKTAIATINYNFDLAIQDYVYVNFVEMIDIIDYLGGVTIDVQQRELSELNKHIRAMEAECDRNLDLVSQAGVQTLSGGQALAYARIRKIDSDIKRTQRCRDVLKAMFDQAKTAPINKLPDVIRKMLGICHTSLTYDEILEMTTWAILNDPEILEYVTPDITADWVWSGTHPDYGWVWIYDLDYASALLIDFIFDDDTAANLLKPTMPNEPKVTAPRTN